jgi:hypothetical protein
MDTRAARGERVASSAAQIGVVAANPVLSNGCKNIDREAVLERLDRMGGVRRDFERLSGRDDLLAVVEDEPQFPRLEHRDLLVLVTMPGYDSSFQKGQPRNSDAAGMDHLPNRVRIHLFFRNLVPGMQPHAGCIVSLGFSLKTGVNSRYKSPTPASMEIE